MNNTPEFLQSEQPALYLLQQLGYHHLTGAVLSAERSDVGDVVLAGRVRAAIWVTPRPITASISIMAAAKPNPTLNSKPRKG